MNNTKIQKPTQTKKNQQPGRIKKYEEQIAEFTGSLNDYDDLSTGAAQHMEAAAEIPVSIVNGLLLAKT